MLVRILVPIISSTISIEKETSSFVSFVVIILCHGVFFLFNSVSLLYIYADMYANSADYCAGELLCIEWISFLHCKLSLWWAPYLRDLSKKNRILTLKVIWRDRFCVFIHHYWHDHSVLHANTSVEVFRVELSKTVVADNVKYMSISDL